MSNDLAHNYGHGFVTAASLDGGVVSEQHYKKIIGQFQRMNTEEAKSAFADKWLRLVKSNLNDTWPIVYELLSVVREKELYKHSHPTLRPNTYESFEEYVVDILGGSLAAFNQLEETFHFAKSNMPELMAATYDVARETTLRARERVKAAAQNTTGKVLPAHRPNKEVGNLPTLPQEGRASTNGVSERTQRKLDALARRAPDLFAAVKEGRMSAHAAAKAAGIVRDLTPLEHLQKWWAKASPEDRAAFRDWIDTPVMDRRPAE